MIRLWLLAGLVVAAAMAPAQAEETRRDLAERAVAALYESDVSERIMAVFWPVALEAIKERAPDVNDVQLFQYRSKAEAFADEAAHAGLTPVVDLFERGFTEKELTAIAAFYESPAGIKLHGAQESVATVLSGAAADSLNAEVNRLRQKVDDMLAADGF